MPWCCRTSAGVLIPEASGLPDTRRRPRWRGDDPLDRTAALVERLGRHHGSVVFHRQPAGAGCRAARGARGAKSVRRRLLLFHRTVRHAGAFELGVMLPYAYRTGLEQAVDPRRRERRRASSTRSPGTTVDAALPFREGASPLRFVPECESWFLERSAVPPTTNMETPGLEHVPSHRSRSRYSGDARSVVVRPSRLGGRRRSSSSCGSETVRRFLTLGPWLHGYDDFSRRGLRRRFRLRVNTRRER